MKNNRHPDESRDPALNFKFLGKLLSEGWIPATALMTVFFGLFLLSFASPARAEIKTATTPDGKTIEFAAGEVLVKFKSNQSFSAKAATLSLYGATSLERLNEIGVDVVSVPSGMTEEAFIAQLRNNPNVEDVGYNHIYRAIFTPNDPQFGSQPELGATILNMIAAWDIERGESSVVVAVLDTGVALDHPDIVSNLWKNTGETASNGIDDDGNTFIDDVDGWNFADGTNNPDDDNGTPLSTDDFHGTHVAGIIGAVTNNGTNIAGVAHNTQVMPVKVLGSDGTGTESMVANGIIYAANNGASVINLSLGSDARSTILENAVNFALGRGVVVVAAAGNTGFAETSCGIEFPAGFSRVIAVGATDNTDNLASFSCTGPEIDLVAPGVSILSLRGSNTGPASDTSPLSGTSFSSPIVAAIAALIRSINSSYSVDEVTQFINFTALDLGSAGFDNSFGFGRLNPVSALQSAESGEIIASNPIDPGKTFSYPSPFKPGNGAQVTISLPSSLGSNQLRIKIFSTAGKRIKTLTNTNQWNGKNDEGNLVSSGVYFYFAETDKGDVSGKLTILK